MDSLNHILSCEDLKPEEALFVGDQPSDRDAAMAAGIAFVQRVTADSNAPEGKLPFKLPASCNLLTFCRLVALFFFQDEIAINLSIPNSSSRLNLLNGTGTVVAHFSTS